MSKLTLSFKGKILKTFPVLPGEMVIGSDPSCIVHIDSLAVQPRHASITTTNDESVLRDQGGPDGTFVNEKRIAEHVLKDGEKIRIGKHTLSFTYVPTEHIAAEEMSDSTFGESDLKLVPKKPPKSAWLQILTGHNVGKTVNLNRNMTNIGKAGVQTAVITRRDDGFFLSHLEGEMTPLVDGKPIGEHSQHLEDGNVIQIGNVKMQFILE